MPSYSAFAKPIKKGLVKALNSIRDQKRRADHTQSTVNLTGKETLVLGRLIYGWKDIVGLQLASKTCPVRFFRGKLFLAVADSQWLQTLTFLRTKIIDKLNEHYPDLHITEVIGRPGTIPAEVKKLVEEAEWPDWNEEEGFVPPEHCDSELSEVVSRCYQKASAKLKGLEKRGYVLCQSCNAAVTKSADAICAVCLFNKNRENFMMVKRLIKEMPWLTVDEVNQMEYSISSGELTAIRSLLFQETTEIIDIVAERLESEKNSELAAEMKKEIVRAIMLDSGCMPDEVDLHNLRKEQIVDMRWVQYIELAEEVGKC